jgi:hypothetical protein
LSEAGQQRQHQIHDVTGMKQQWSQALQAGLPQREPLTQQPHHPQLPEREPGQQQQEVLGLMKNRRSCHTEQCCSCL